MNKKTLEYGKNPSPMRQLFDYGKKKKLEVGEDKIFDFSLGNPSVPAPEVVNRTLKRLLEKSSSVSIHGYTSAIGDINVRNSIADYLNKTYNAEVEGKYIIMTCGSAASLAIAFNAILEPEDEVILFAPYYTEYKVLVDHARGKAVIINTNKDLLPDLDILEKSMNEKTKIVLVNSPNNPSGAFYDEELIKDISNLLERKQKEYGHSIFLLSDEPYREFLYEGEKYPFVTNYYDNSVVCYSFSKCISLPGDRIGYFLINPKMKEKDELLYCSLGVARGLGFVCAPSLFQYMVPHILGYTSDLEIYKTNRDLLYNILTEIGYDCIFPKGAFYLFMKSLEDDAEHFSEVAKEYGLLLVPSNSFGINGYIRLAYCVSKDMILRSKEAFKKLFERYQK